MKMKMSSHSFEKRISRNLFEDKLCWLESPGPRLPWARLLSEHCGTSRKLVLTFTNKSANNLTFFTDRSLRSRKDKAGKFTCFGLSDQTDTNKVHNTVLSDIAFYNSRVIVS